MKNIPSGSTGSRGQKQLKVAGLFAGIGGFEVGFKRAGYDTAFLCELDPRAQSVLRANFPGVDLIGDIRDVGALPPDVLP